MRTADPESNIGSEHFESRTWRRFFLSLFLSCFQRAGVETAMMSLIVQTAAIFSLHQPRKSGGSRPAQLWTGLIPVEGFCKRQCVCSGSVNYMPSRAVQARARQKRTELQTQNCCTSLSFGLNYFAACWEVSVKLSTALSDLKTTKAFMAQLVVALVS